MPDWDDPRSMHVHDRPTSNWLEPPEEADPDWKDDLESLFKHVDSRLAERRAAVSLPPDGLPDRRAAAPIAQAPRPIAEPAPPATATESGLPKSIWLGFGLEEEVQVAVEEPGPVEQLAGEVVTQLRATLEANMHAAMRVAVREAVDEALRDRLAAEVRAGVEAALRADAARRSSEDSVSPSTIVAIRVRQRGSRKPA